MDVDAVRLLNVCTKSNFLIKEGEEKVDMCSGLKALIEEGREEGRYKKLTEQVKKKVQKGYSADEIADMLEEHVDVITKIIKEIEM